MTGWLRSINFPPQLSVLFTDINVLLPISSGVEFYVQIQKAKQQLLSTKRLVEVLPIN